jgi:hypothetical protein
LEVNHGDETLQGMPDTGCVQARGHMSRQKVWQVSQKRKSNAYEAQKGSRQ